MGAPGSMAVEHWIGIILHTVREHLHRRKFLLKTNKKGFTSSRRQREDISPHHDSHHHNHSSIPSGRCVYVCVCVAIDKCARSKLIYINVLLQEKHARILL
jgi:hypothetical protein